MNQALDNKFIIIHSGKARIYRLKYKSELKGIHFILSNSLNKVYVFKHPNILNNENINLYIPGLS